MSKQRTSRGKAGRRPQPRPAKRQPAREAKGTRPGRRGRGGRIGWAGMRRSRRQRFTIGAVAVVALALIWIFADWRLAVPLTALLVLALPAVVVLSTGRRY